MDQDPNNDFGVFIPEASNQSSAGDAFHHPGDNKLPNTIASSCLPNETPLLQPKQPNHVPPVDPLPSDETAITNKWPPEGSHIKEKSGVGDGVLIAQPGLTSHDEAEIQTLPIEHHSSSESAEVTEEQDIKHSVSGTCIDAEQEATRSQEPTLSDGFKRPEPNTRPESLLLSPLTHPNGIAIFPGLSTSEQEDISREALDQAEESIIAESNGSIGTGTDDDDDDDGSDGGYDSEGFSAASTSAESSVRDYMYENGRRYHKFREGRYNFPNDDVEQEREDMKHAMVKLLCGQKLHFAPIGDNPQEILDIGTGTGIWPIEKPYGKPVGDQYPSAHILGIDLSPIQPDWLPPNVRFLVDDVESLWLHPRNHFDYIHARHTVMAVRDWMKLFRRSIEHLKPGGWIELQEIHHIPRSALPGVAMAPDHAVAQFWKNVTEGLGALGVDLDTASGGKLANMMQQAGFTNVTERVLHVPIGTWPKNKVLKTVGLYWRTILLDGLQAIALGPLTRGLSWNREQVEVFLMHVRRAYFDNASLMYMPLHIVYAQKPLYGV